MPSRTMRVSVTMRSIFMRQRISVLMLKRSLLRRISHRSFRGVARTAIGLAVGRRCLLPHMKRSGAWPRESNIARLLGIGWELCRRSLSRKTSVSTSSRMTRRSVMKSSRKSKRGPIMELQKVIRQTCLSSASFPRARPGRSENLIWCSAQGR